MMASAEGGEGAGRPNLPPSNWAGVLLPAALAGAASGPPPALWLREGRIVAVGAAALAAGPEVPRRALPGLTLAPAPLDGHVHLALGAGWAANLAACRRAGLAAVRDLGFPARKSPREPLPSPPPLVILAGRGLGPAGEARSWLAEALTGPAAFAPPPPPGGGGGGGKLFASGLWTSPARGEHPRTWHEETGAWRRPGGLPVRRTPAAARPVPGAGVDSLEHGFQGEANCPHGRAGDAWLPTWRRSCPRRGSRGTPRPPVRANWPHRPGQPPCRRAGMGGTWSWARRGYYGLPPVRDLRECGPAGAGLGREVFAAATWRARLLGGGSWEAGPGPGLLLRWAIRRHPALGRAVWRATRSRRGGSRAGAGNR